MSYISPVFASPGLSLAPSLTPAEFAAIAAIMQEKARIHLPDTKMTLVHSRLGRRLRVCGVPDFSAYINLVGQDPVEMKALVEALTTNHTHFFREAHHFEHLQQEALPMLKGKARQGGARIWSAGCSSGEEVYTIAMTLLGTDRGAARWALNGDVRLLATDISSEVVAAAAAGRYEASLLEQIPPAYRSLWTQTTAQGFEIAADIRSMVSARTLNLFEPWPMQRRFDVIFCRNVMIYFDNDAKAELEQRLVDQLEPGGYLYIGHSERLNSAARDRMQPCGQTIYRKSGGYQ